MRARICGPQELYVKEDSEVSMRCELSQGPHDLGTIFWYLGNVPVYTDQASLQSVRQPRVSVHTEWVDGLKSTLHIARAKLTDSGNYTCMPTFGQSATINVHVVNGNGLVNHIIYYRFLRVYFITSYINYNFPTPGYILSIRAHLYFH